VKFLNNDVVLRILHHRDKISNNPKNGTEMCKLLVGYLWILILRNNLGSL